jgi:hypothetical protein
VLTSAADGLAPFADRRPAGRVVYRIVFADEVVAANALEAVRAFLADEIQA